MNSLYNHGIKQTQLLVKELSTFEKNLSTSPLSLQGLISTSLGAFKKTVKEYGDLVQQNLSDENSAKHEARLSKFNKDAADFQQKFDSLKLQRETMAHENNRQELLGRRHQAQTSENPYEAEEASQNQHLSRLEGLYNERQSLGRGSQQLDHILEMGQQALEDIVGQNEILQNLGTRFEDSLVTLGVSQGTIRAVEKRAREDKWLFWGGLALVMVLFWLIVRWLR